MKCRKHDQEDCPERACQNRWRQDSLPLKRATPLDHYCMVCRCALIRVRQDGQYRWEHSAATVDRWSDPAHDPVPVPLAELTDTNMVCDFCSAVPVLWQYTFADVTAVFANDEGHRFTERLGAVWQACQGCADRVEGNDLEGLVTRGAGAAARHHGHPLALAKMAVRPVYQALLAEGWRRIPAQRQR